ncbi:hypothetical protein BJ741DRAFT_591811 [Chytriomyces cf. hyalinus JEL632]|nr:hypothetical protein BJ741DRAFT_591811 [Chytriomyces cf. hyalinus JEL632]
MLGEGVNAADVSLIQQYATVSMQIMELIPYEAELKTQVAILQTLEENGPSRIAAVKAASKKVADAREHLDGAEGMFVMNREKERSKRREVYAANQHAERTAIDIMTSEIEQLNATSVQVSELGRKIEFLQSKRDQLDSIVSKIFSVDPDREEMHVSRMLDKAISNFFKAHKDFAGIREAIDAIGRAHKLVTESWALSDENSNSVLLRLFSHLLMPNNTCLGTFTLALYFLTLANQSWPNLRQMPIPGSLENSGQLAFSGLTILANHFKVLLKFLSEEEVEVVANVRKCSSNVIGAARQAHSVRYKVLELRKQMVLGEDYPANAEGEVSALLFRIDLEYLEKVSNLDVVVKDENAIGKAASQIYVDDQLELDLPTYA